MSASPLKQYLDRSMGILRRNTSKVLRMDIGSTPPPLPILSFTSPRIDIPSYAQGCDADIGGLSTCSLTPIASSSGESSSSAKRENSHVAFHGNLSLAIPPAYQGKIRTGYAAFRNKTRPTLFGDETWDMSLYSHLRVVVGYRGWEGWRDRWVVNIQTDGPVRSDLFQHRLPLPSSPLSTSSPAPLDPSSPPPPTFSTLHLPLASFVLTNSGQTASQQIPMMRTKIRTLGFALLGGGRTTEDASAPISSAFGGSGVQSDLQKMGAGGWRGGEGAGEVEVDRELEELMRSDQPEGSRPVQGMSNSGGGGGGGYHRVGSSTAPEVNEPVIPRSIEVDGGTAGIEGYYELCIKSVEAVRYDPEVDDADDIDP